MLHPTILSTRPTALWPSLDLRSSTAGRSTVSLLLPPCEATPGTCPAPAQLFQRPALPKHSGQDRLCCFCQEEGTCIKMAGWQPWLSPHHHLKQLQLLPGGRGGECTAHRSQTPSLPGSCICWMWGSDCLFVLKPTESISALVLLHCWSVTRSSSQGTPGTPAMHVTSPSLGTPGGLLPFLQRST